MKKKNIAILYAIALLQGMVFYGPVATLYRQARGVSILQIAIIESISLLLCLLLELPWGIVADKIGYKRTMIFCCVLYFLSKVVFWQADGFFAFLLERVMLSAVIAGMSGVDTAVLFLSCPSGASQRVFGIYNSLQTAGMLAAALAFTVFVGENDALAGFLTVVSYLLAALLSLCLVEVSAAGSGRVSARGFAALLRQLLGQNRLLLFLIGVALFNETHQTITVFLNQLQYVKCGLSPSAIGAVYIAVTIAGLCGVCSARLTKKAGASRTAALLFAAAAASCLLLAFTSKAWLSVLGILTLRISFSLFQPLQTELQNIQVTTGSRATALSLNAVILDSVGVGANIVFGMAAEHSLTGAFLLGSVFCVVGAVLFAVWVHSRKGIPGMDAVQ